MLAFKAKKRKEGGKEGGPSKVQLKEKIRRPMRCAVLSEYSEGNPFQEKKGV